MATGEILWLFFVPAQPLPKEHGLEATGGRQKLPVGGGKDRWIVA
jgi:hypothetical protein